MSAHFTEGKRRAIKGPDNSRHEWDRPGCGFVLAQDETTVIGRFPRFEDAQLDAVAPDLLAACEAVQAASRLELNSPERLEAMGRALGLVNAAVGRVRGA